MKGDGWVLRNLAQYGNSIVPDALIKTMNNDINLTERLIEYAYGQPVKIHNSKSGYIVEEVGRR